MLGHPEGRGRATPIVFGQKLKLLKNETKVLYFSKFLLHQLAYDLENFPGRATPILVKN